MTVVSFIMADAVGPHILFTIFTIFWCICILQILGIYRFCELRGLAIIDKRYPRFVVLEAIASCLTISIIWPASLCQHFGYPVVWEGWPSYLSVGAVCLTYQIVPLTETCRLWLISYDLQYLHSSKNQQWKIAIDASYADKDWYLQNRGKWGDERYIARLGFIFHVVTSTAFCTMFSLYFFADAKGLYVVVPAFLGFTIYVAVPLYLYITTPRNLQDQYLFHYEFRVTAIAMTIILFGILTVNTLYILGYPGPARLTNALNVICGSVPSLLSTLWIPYKVRMMKEWNPKNTTSELERTESPGTFREKLRETLSDEQKCEAFIDWMYREFCSEVILSFLEFVQFRNYVKAEIRKTDGNDVVAGDSDPYDFVLYDGMPKSSIIYDSGQSNEGISQEMTLSWLVHVSSLSRDTDSGAAPTENTLIKCKRIAHLFFRKYIEHHSELEINISGSLRNKYVDLEQKEYDGMNVKQFVTLYDKVLAEMMKYQSQSYQRFERANQN